MLVRPKDITPVQMKTGPNTANVQGQRRRAAAPIGEGGKNHGGRTNCKTTPPLFRARCQNCTVLGPFFSHYARAHRFNSPPKLWENYTYLRRKRPKFQRLRPKRGIIYPHGIRAKYGPFLWVPCSCSVEVLRGAGFLFLFYQLKPYGNYGDQYAPKQIDEKNLAPVVDF